MLARGRMHTCLVITWMASACGGGGNDGAGTHRGQITVIGAVAIPEAHRATLLQAADVIEAQGKWVAPDGTQVSFPADGAAGWIVEFGDQRVPTELDGSFVVEVADGVTQGNIYHPSDLSTAIGTIAVADLDPPEGEPSLTLEILNGAPCGMYDIDPLGPAGTGLLCGDTAAAAAPHVHVHGAAAVVKDNPTPAKTDGALGSYPVGNQSSCLDYDGDPTADRETVLGTFQAYNGSTCDLAIRDGCCDNELGQVSVSAKTAIGSIFKWVGTKFGTTPLYSFTPVSCSSNHKGRFCQEVTKGDLSLQTPQNGIRGAGTWELGADLVLPERIALGETVGFTVHNNGCYGETLVRKIDDQLHGTVTGTGYNGAVIAHYNAPARYGAYVPDRALAYQAPLCPTSLAAGDHDTYRFDVDGWHNYIRFEIDSEGLWQLPGGQIFSESQGAYLGFWIGDPEEPSTANEFMGCPGYHVHGNHPCTGAPDPAPHACGHGQVSPFVPR